MVNGAIEKQMIYVDSINLFFWSEYLSVISPNAGKYGPEKTHVSEWLISSSSRPGHGQPLMHNSQY